MNTPTAGMFDNGTSNPSYEREAVSYVSVEVSYRPLDVGMV
jgi:hypothetical protein